MKTTIKNIFCNKVSIVSSLIVISVFSLLWLTGSSRLLVQYLWFDSDRAVAARGDNKGEFPEVAAFNLLGKKFNLPGDFAKPYNIVILAYDREQQKDVYTWLPLLQKLATDFPKVAYYELPTLPEYNALARAQIDNWMLAGISDKDDRDRTITIYLDVESFNQALKIKNTREIQILLVTPEGEILWQEKGAFSKVKGEELQKQIFYLHDLTNFWTYIM